MLVNSAKLAVIVDLLTPTIVKQLRSNLGHTGYYRKFIRGYTMITTPMEKLLKKDEKFEWNDECQGSLDNLKQKVVATPTLVSRLDEGVPHSCRCFISRIGGSIGSARGRRNRPVDFVYKSKAIYHIEKLHNEREGRIGDGVCITIFMP